MGSLLKRCGEGIVTERAKELEIFVGFRYFFGEEKKVGIVGVIWGRGEELEVEKW